jgi:NADH dehydrogenase (ubiquinone) Fe-S protein 3
MNLQKRNNNKSLIFSKSLIEKIPKLIDYVHIKKDQIEIGFDKKYIKIIFFFLKKHITCKYESLIDVTCIDYPNNNFRYKMVYNLLSVRFNNRLLLKTNLDIFASINSLIFLYKSANWLEREVWDMFGIFFSNHEDLRRILTDYGFQGFPLRKDFPLTGFLELRYDDENKRVVYDELELSQDFRFFDFQSPWLNK